MFFLLYNYLNSGGRMKDKRKGRLIILGMIVIVVCIALVLVIKMYNRNIYQNASLPHSDVVCEKGQYFSEGQCLLCPAGSYCYENNRYFCPAGTGSLSEASTLMNCSNCAIGYYSEGDGSGCVACPSGMTTKTTGATSVNDCI